MENYEINEDTYAVISSCVGKTQIIEKYGDSYYHEVQNCIDLAGREGIKIAGVVAYR